MRWLILFIFTATTCLAEDHALDGHWEGAVSRFGAVQTVHLDINRTNDSLSAHYSIPELGLYDEAADIAMNGDTVRLYLWYGDFPMLWHREIDELTGINENWNPAVALHLKRSASRRNYDTEPIAFESPAGMLRGRLYRPNGTGPFPGLVVVHGSGPQGLDEWMYRSWGNLFADRGIATLVFNKRGVGVSDGDYETATFEDLASDAAAAWRALKNRPDIDSTNIGMMGVSQGGWIVPMAMRNIDPAFTILLVAPAVDVWTQEKQRIELTMRANGYAEPEVAQAQEVADLLFKVAGDVAPYDAFGAISKRYDSVDWFQTYFGGYTSIDSITGWQRQQYDPASDLKSINCPTLVIYGANDLLVPPSGNKQLMETYLKVGPTKQFSVATINGVGHDMMTGHSLIGTAWDWPSQFWRWNRRPHHLFELLFEFIDRRIVPTD